MKTLSSTFIVLILLSCFLIGCGTDVAQEGDSVRVRYIGRLDTGEVFDSSQTDLPMVFSIGAGQVIPGFDKAVTGMAVGETKTVTLPPEDAYGMPDSNLTHQMLISDFPPDITPSVGQILDMGQPDGRAVQVLIENIKEDTVYLNANHYLAGKTLVFDLELIEIVK
ncbi:MAG: peptidylprolyl isomerase [candidate division Zixibacteria bacterium]|nr:peptidylprolyl isomerase [candidate division Zixibacteria bacterium]